MRLYKKALSATLALAITATSLAVAPKAITVDAATDYNYGDALSKSLLFYELQESGKLEDDIRTNWRGDSALEDGADNNVDLTGGWYDAGDHLKLNLPMSFTGTMLAWSYLEDPEVYAETGQDKYMLQQLKRVNDYFIRCHASKDEYYFQVGDASDHAFWGAAEIMQMTRPSYKVTLSQPGSCVCAETAASLAAASMVFAESDPDFAAECLKHAEELYDLADRMQSDSYYSNIAGAYYNSYSGFADEMSWAGAWLYKKTGNQDYLDKAIEYSNDWEVVQGTTKWAYKWTHGWDNKTYGARLLLAQITGDSKFVESTEEFLDYWTTGVNGERVKYSPKGLAWLDTWGSLRYASTTAFLACIWAESDLCTDSKVDIYEDFAKSQADYCLGSSGRSYVCGYGENYPKSPHHRIASGVYTNNCGADPVENRHTLVGALVGGPDASDAYTDDRTNYITNEVADDYNAGFTGLMAKMYKEFGGTVDPNLNAVEEVGEELYLLAGVNSKYEANNNTFVEIKATVYNTTAWPARVTDKLSYRYFVDISDVIANGGSAADFTVSTNYNQSGAVVSQLLPWDAENGIYYTEIDMSGAKIYPGGQSEYRSELQFRIGVQAAWDYTASPSFQGLAGTSNNNTVRAEGIALYDDGTLVFGSEPNGEAVVKPSVEPSTTPSEDPIVSEEPSEDPIVSEEPSEAPIVSEEPSENPIVSEEPSEEPIVTEAPDGDTNVQVTITNNGSNTIGGQWTVTNSKGSVNLNDVAIRYYFTDDNSSVANTVFVDNVGLSLTEDPWYAALTSSTTAKVVKMANPTATADSYLEITFKNANYNLKSGASLSMGIRLAKNDWSNFITTNDYSAKNGAVVIVDGAVVSGTLPQ